MDDPITWCECAHDEREHTDAEIDPRRGCFGESGFSLRTRAPLVWGPCSCEHFRLWYVDA